MDHTVHRHPDLTRPAARPAQPVGESAAPLYAAALACCLLLVAYGSLLPFQFRLPADQVGNGWLSLIGFILTQPSIVKPTFDDLLTNLILYMPSGALAAILLRRSRLGIEGRWIMLVFGYASLIWCLESLQGLMPARFASINDWALNLTGAVVGGILSASAEQIARSVARFARLSTRIVIGWLTRQCGWRWRPAALGIVLVAGLIQVIWQLWQVMQRTGRMPARPAGPVDWLPFARQWMHDYLHAGHMLLMDAAWYGVMGVALWLTMRWLRLGRRTWPAALAVALIALAGEMINLLRAVARPDSTEPLLALLAAGFTIAILQRLTRPIALTR
jgi:VanZ family protein